MKRPVLTALAIFVWLSLVGCSRPTDSAREEKVPSGLAEAKQTAGSADLSAHGKQHGAAIARARQQAAELDTRTPVPMIPKMSNHQKQNMRGHLGAVERIVAALSREDWGGVTEASLEIGSSDPMRRMCGRMGAGAPAMAKMGLAFHEQADAIADAAQKQDTAAVLSALSGTLQICNGCHAAFRQDVVDFETYQARVDAVQGKTGSLATNGRLEPASAGTPPSSAGPADQGGCGCQGASKGGCGCQGAGKGGCGCQGAGPQ